MSFWNFIFSKKAAEKKYCEFPYPFKPNPSGIIELISEGISSDLTPPQKDFIAWIEREYHLLTSRLIPLLEKKIHAWQPQLLIKDFAKEFIPICLSIPTCDQHPVEWEIVFDNGHDANHIVTVGMLGNEPQYVRVDG